jgi:hypothetical protein
VVGAVAAAGGFMSPARRDGAGAQCSSHVRFVDRGAAFAGSSPGGVEVNFSLLAEGSAVSIPKQAAHAYLCLYAGRQVSCKYNNWLMLINTVKASI